jgi:hypothetical protein
MAFSGCANHDSLRPAHQIDLRPLGLKVEADWRTVSYNQIAFLSDSLLIVAINQRTFTQAGEPSNTDIPASKFYLFDIVKNSVVKSAEMPLEKESGSIQVISNERFVVWNQSGYLICNTELSCSPPIVAFVEGPILTSPTGRSFVVGGFGRTQQCRFYSSPLKEQDCFPWGNPAVVPGEEAILMLYEQNSKLHIKEDNGPERILPFGEGAGNHVFLPSSRFLSNVVIGVSESVENLLVAEVDGTTKYRIPVNSWYQGTSLITSASGRRFGIQETKFTRWNSIVHFYDFERSRAYDLERTRVLDVATGKSLFDLVSDPRPYTNRLTIPALSPDGQHLAVIHRGVLDVYDIP